MNAVNGRRAFSFVVELRIHHRQAAVGNDGVIVVQPGADAVAVRCEERVLHRQVKIPGVWPGIGLTLKRNGVTIALDVPGVLQGAVFNGHIGRIVSLVADIDQGENVQLPHDLFVRFDGQVFKGHVCAAGNQEAKIVAAGVSYKKVSASVRSTSQGQVFFEDDPSRLILPTA